MPSFLASERSNKLPSTATGNVTSETQITGSDGNVLICPIPGSNVLKNRRFTIRYSGHGTSGTTSTLALKFYLGTSTTISSNSALCTITSASFASGSHSFFGEIVLYAESVGSTIEGYYTGTAVNTLITTAVVTAQSSFNPATEGQGFTVTALFGSTNASNTFVMDTFELIPD